MEFEIVETSRLLLRKLTPEVYDYIFSNYSDEECMHFLGFTQHEEIAREKEKYNNGLECHDRTFVIFQLVLKETKEVIGATGFVRYYPKHYRGELGYAITKEKFKRKGYMFEATKPMISYGFNQMGLKRIEAFAGPDNVASLKILEKLNFEKEGLLKQHYFRNGIGEDSVVFALLK